MIFHTAPGTLAPLTLAYVGDAVFELSIRTRLAAENRPMKELHRRAVSLVCAASQARMAHHIETMLTPDEHAVWKRGRNAKPGTSPRSAEMHDYRHSTAFEAVLGYLYLSGQTTRLEQLIEQALSLESAEPPTAPSRSDSGESPFSQPAD